VIWPTKEYSLTPSPFPGTALVPWFISTSSSLSIALVRRKVLLLRGRAFHPSSASSAQCLPFQHTQVILPRAARILAFFPQDPPARDVSNIGGPFFRFADVVPLCGLVLSFPHAYEVCPPLLYTIEEEPFPSAFFTPF